MDEQMSMFADNPEYEAFVDKFKPKKTTDDCYTPPLVYEVVKDWACEEYGIDPACIVRPFYPGGDYEHFPYAPDSVVLDNPPFSILAKICDFYIDKGIPFFLFGPSLTAFSGRKNVMRINHIICDGAVVRTAFLTSYGGYVAQTAPDLGRRIAKAMQEIKAETKKELPKYAYPSCVVTAAMLQRYAHYGVDFRIEAKDCTPVYKLDSQAGKGKAIFGGGLLLSERAAAEKAAKHIWELSEREKRIVESLGE